MSLKITKQRTINAEFNVEEEGTTVLVKQTYISIDENAVSSVQENMPFYAYYDQFKKQQLLKWLENSHSDIIGGAGRMYTASGNWISSAYLEIALESSSIGGGGYMLQMRFKNYSRDPRPIPAGRQNRLEWIENNLENIR